MVYLRAMSVWIRDMRTPPEEIAASESKRLAEVRVGPACLPACVRSRAPLRGVALADGASTDAGLWWFLPGCACGTFGWGR